jgi:hypothetical protein
MSEQEKHILETFLQYGDLKKARLVFVGLEEGLGIGKVQEAIDARMILSNDRSFLENRIYLNEENINDGWYISNALHLDQAREQAKNKPKTPLDEITPDYSKSLTMRMQARLHWLIQGNNRNENYVNIPSNFKSYKSLNVPGSENAMIDVFPFPKVSANNWPKEYKNQFSAKKDYYDHYCHPDNIRMKIIRGLYDTFPLNISISYAGILKGDFKLRSFYESLGFEFGPNQYTNTLNPKYNGSIKPSKRPKPFAIGHRTNQLGIYQEAILTPFFGTGQISFNDIDVISTWIEL